MSNNIYAKFSGENAHDGIVRFSDHRLSNPSLLWRGLKYEVIDISTSFRLSIAEAHAADVYVIT